jgi:hypothetical protein
MNGRELVVTHSRADVDGTAETHVLRTAEDEPILTERP